jgi:hypothetical protein
MILRAMGTPWILARTYTRSTLPTCKSPKSRRFLWLTLVRGLFEADMIDWWDRSWGGFFQTFGDFLGFKWEVMGEFNLYLYS